MIACSRAFLFRWALLGLIGLPLFPSSGMGQEEPKPDYPPLEEVIKGFEEIPLSTNDTNGATPPRSFYRMWINRKTNQMLAELPVEFAAPTHKQFIATTLSGGDVFAGLQSSDFYVYWKQYGKRLALVQENVSIRGSDDESKASVKRLFTDRILMDLPILAMVQRGGPVIDLDEFLVNNAGVFFGNDGRTSKPYLSRVERVKAFPKNIEVAWEMATNDGSLKTFHYSISELKGTEGYKPRKADQRIGYFTTGYADYGKYDGDDTRVRFINRWNLEKRDPSLKLSPPKQPIVFYIEHTTPVRYRRWVRDGVLHWNKAFEQVGIVNAIEVRQQDKQSGEHMEKDPEDVRYNFLRWLNNNVSTAIGPSRVNPLTGEILDADIVLTDGWIRTFENQFDELMPKIVMEGMTPETLAWFAEHPEWDPRLRLVSPGKREFVRQSLILQNQARMGNHEPQAPQTRMLGDEPGDGLYNRESQVNGGCVAAEGRQFDVAIMRMAMQLVMENQEPVKPETDDKPKDEPKTDSGEQILDGMPESFIGPLLADLVCHEVGHTMGLRHNFKASSIYTLAQINSEEIKGKKPLAGSVMDYLPTNFNFEGGPIQGDYTMVGVGPYDLWAIQYGYTMDEAKLPEILKRVAEPELVFGTDEDTVGSDPLARRYDFSKDPLDFARSQVGLAKHHRAQILEKFVKDGDAWDKARKGYQLTLGLQAKSTSMMANWLGGTFINRDKKGDPNGRKPIEVVSAAQQRAALQFVIENTFRDEAYGLTPDLLVHLVGESWRDTPGASSELPWAVHDQVMALQAGGLSQIMNPSVLRRVYDNELRSAPETDVVTLNELMREITTSVWSELEKLPEGKATERAPTISSLRRNLQAEHLGRLLDLARSGQSGVAAMKPISNLAALTLRQLGDKLNAVRTAQSLDAYSAAHVADMYDRINRWAEGKYSPPAASAPIFFGLGATAEKSDD